MDTLEGRLLRSARARQALAVVVSSLLVIGLLGVWLTLSTSFGVSTAVSDARSLHSIDSTRAALSDVEHFVAQAILQAGDEQAVAEARASVEGLSNVALPDQPSQGQPDVRAVAEEVITSIEAGDLEQAETLRSESLGPLISSMSEQLETSQAELIESLETADGVAARTSRLARVAATLLIPALVMAVYWLHVRDELRRRLAGFEAKLAVGKSSRDAADDFIAGVIHELEVHGQRFDLGEEVDQVASAYSEVGADLRVAVPEVKVVSDPRILRHVLHQLVSEALEHGGERVAVWAEKGDHFIDLVISDDGDALSADIEAALDRRTVSLDRGLGATSSDGLGLLVARDLCEKLGARLSYQRDDNWAHLRVRMPIEPELRSKPNRQKAIELGTRAG